MAKTYIPVGWKNKPSKDTPINADNLKHMDDAILDLYEGGATTNDVVISDTQPTGDDWKLWIDKGEIGSQTSEITNEYSESTGLGYSANYVNKLHKYSTDETVIGTDENGNNIYRKIITGTTDSTDGVWKTIGNPITNIDKIKRLTGMLTNKISLPAFVVSGYSVALQYETNVGVQVLAYGYLNTTVEITIEYTKNN